MTDVTAIRERFLALSLHLDERGRRIFAATEARTTGHGGIAAVSRATGIAASTIGRGLAELSAADQLVANRVRRPGGGDKPLVNKDPNTILSQIVAQHTSQSRAEKVATRAARRTSRLHGIVHHLGTALGGRPGQPRSPPHVASESRYFAGGRRLAPWGTRARNPEYRIQRAAVVGR